MFKIKFVFNVALFAINLSLTSDVPNKNWKLKCLDDMVPTGLGTCIDRYEWPNIKDESVSVTLSALPMAHDIKAKQLGDINSLCESRGKRVCSRQEWVTACKGPQRFTYSWGNTRPKKHKKHPCNTDKRWKKPDENKVARRDPDEIKRLDQSEPSGNRLDCKPWDNGPYDMVGNVEEWVKCPGIGKYGWCLMGRHWASVVTCEQTISVHAPRWSYYETGGRCCADGETK